MKKIFVSYSTKDRVIVSLLCKEIERCGVSVWLDERELGIGDPLVSRIFAALQTVDYVLTVISGNSLRSDWCKREFEAAAAAEIEQGRELIMPVLVEGSDLPDYLRGRKYCNFSDSKIFETELAKLVESLGGASYKGRAIHSFVDILPSFSDLVDDFRHSISSKLDILLVNGGATIPGLIVPHLGEVASKVPQFRLRMTLLNVDVFKLVTKYEFEDGFRFGEATWDASLIERAYEALIWESKCLQNIGDHKQQIKRSVKGINNILRSHPNIVASIRANPRLPFCRLLILDDVVYYTPLLASLPFCFHTFKLRPTHPLYEHCKEHFEFLYETGEDLNSIEPGLTS